MYLFPFSASYDFVKLLRQHQALLIYLVLFLGSRMSRKHLHVSKLASHLSSDCPELVLYIAAWKTECC